VAVILSLAGVRPVGGFVPDLRARDRRGFRITIRVWLRFYRWGGLLSLSGLVFGVAGVWRPGQVRWLAPVCSSGTLLFWFASAMGE
jgi:hypothetical protein